MADYNDDVFWLTKPEILLENPDEFFPVAEMSKNGKLNALTRLIIYVSIALSVNSESVNPLVYGSVIILIMIIFYKNSCKRAKFVKEKMVGRACTMPTKNNPYMNILYGDSLSKAKPCKGVGEESEKYLNEQLLFKDVQDLYSKRANQRLFNTVPRKDRDIYSDFLIPGEVNRKANPFEDLRYSRRT